MYTSYFGLNRQPFNIAPDPQFLYPTPVYQKAYATLWAGIHERKGFLVLTGEAGTGKTTLLHQLMADLEKESTINCVFFPNAVMSFDELLTATCRDLGLEENETGRLKKIQSLSKFLTSRSPQSGTTVLLIDEAHTLDQSVLEDIRLLSNIEKENEKLLQIVFSGQPELELKLGRPRLRQLKQRVALACRLGSLSPEEVGSFIHSRLDTAGASTQNLFSQAALQRIVGCSQGIPRLINVICDNALLLAYATARKTITPEIIQEVADNLQLQAAIDPPPEQEPPLVGEVKTVSAEKVRKIWWPGRLERLPRRLAWTAGAAACFTLVWLAVPFSKQVQPEKVQEEYSKPAKSATVVRLPLPAEEEGSLDKAVGAAETVNAAWEPAPVHSQPDPASDSRPVINFAVSIVPDGQAADSAEPWPQETLPATTPDGGQTDEPQTDEPQKQTALSQDVIDQATLPEEIAPEQAENPPSDIEHAEAPRPIELLARAEQQMARQRLSMPAGDNALETYQHVLNLVPDQPDAIRGIQKIQDQYRRWAEKAEQRQDWPKAQSYYENVLAIHPDAETDETIVSALSRVKEQQLLPSATAQRGEETRPQERPDERQNARAQLAQLGIPYQQEAFIKSAEAGDTPTVLAFVTAGMSPNVTDARGWDALMMAAFNDHPTTVQALLEQGADSQVSNKTGGTPLMMAAMHGSTDIVNVLIERSAAVNTKDAKGWTAAMYAAWNGHTSTVRALAKHGADLNTTDRDGWNALMYAVWKGQTDTVRTLLNSGAHVGAKNAQGNSALTLAQRRGSAKIVELLKQAGARE